MMSGGFQQKIWLVRPFGHCALVVTMRKLMRFYHLIILEKMLFTISRLKLITLILSKMSLFITAKHSLLQENAYR